MGEITKEFPEGKENYCPQCYFEDDKVILRKDCPHKIKESPAITNTKRIMNETIQRMKNCHCDYLAESSAEEARQLRSGSGSLFMLRS